MLEHYVYTPHTYTHIRVLEHMCTYYHTYTQIYICALELMYTHHTHTHLCPGAYVYTPHTYMQIYIPPHAHNTNIHTDSYTRALEPYVYIPHTQGNKICFSENVEAFALLPFLNSHT